MAVTMKYNIPHNYIPISDILGIYISLISIIGIILFTIIVFGI